MTVTPNYLPSQHNHENAILVCAPDHRVTGLVWQLEPALRGRTSPLTEPDQLLPCLDQTPFSLLLLDLDTPHLNAVEVIRRIRQRHSTYELPILLIASEHKKSTRNEALMAGANDFLNHPVDPIDLSLRIRNAWANRDLHLSNQVIHRHLEQEIAERTAKLEMLIVNGMMISTERDRSALLRHILFEGQRLLHCDGGTVYLVTKKNTLHQKCLHFSLRTRNDPLPSLDLPLLDAETGEPNEKHVSTWVAIHNRPVLIDDVYYETRFDLSGTRHFDAESHYRTISMLTVPMTPRGGGVIGVIQFMNAKDPQTGAIIPFAPELVALVEALAAQTAVALDNLRLEQARQEQECVLFQQSRLAAMGEMIGNIAHQWRQPLNILSLTLANIREASRQASLDESLLERLFMRSNQTIQRMSGTIEDFLNFFKPDKTLEVFNPCDGISGILDLVGHHYRHDKIDIEIERLATTCACRGYPREFAQVVLNILTNAKDAILDKHQSGKIWIRAFNQGDTITIAIRDTGGGVPQDILDKVFDPYFTTKDKGTGIGLYMSKTIMQNMGGDISLRNTNEGAEVLISLPMEKP